MPRSDHQISVQLVMEALGANANDLAMLLDVQKRSIISYSTGQYKLSKDRTALLRDVTNMMVEADRNRPSTPMEVLPAELEALKRRYLRNDRLADRLALAITKGKDQRAYALKTMELIEGMEARIAGRSANDPVVQLIRIARARNTKRLRSHSMEHILAQEARLAGLKASLNQLDAVLSKHEPGWKEHYIERGKKIIEKEKKGKTPKKTR